MLGPEPLDMEITIKQIKRELGITNKEIAEFFQFKSYMGYANSTSKPRIENGIIELYKLMKSEGTNTKPLP